MLVRILVRMAVNVPVYEVNVDVDVLVLETVAV